MSIMNKRLTIHLIISDDLDVAPDFYEYFSATYPILRSDPTLWCVSAWNDNGKISCFALSKVRSGPVLSLAPVWNDNVFEILWIHLILSFVSCVLSR